MCELLSVMATMMVIAIITWVIGIGAIWLMLVCLMYLKGKDDGQRIPHDV